MNINEKRCFKKVIKKIFEKNFKPNLYVSANTKAFFID